MSGKTMIVVIASIIGGALAVANYIFEQRRYLTNNPNATGNDFHVYQDLRTCPVCIEDMDVENASSCTVLNCGHYLHRSCLLEMDQSRGLFETNKCPVCRTPIKFS
ncbi:uncharacterized protein LOC129905926 [Episyrphus balteatus]|uniref:uncharacterized protein LOC129905926 n=1 Tax=Episyrphus balteatus TaxID=286459 RepID=UPI0024852A32|nr:uncharacterized protein LOC129905926 [Episyrphus balteatus]